MSTKVKVSIIGLNNLFSKVVSVLLKQSPAVKSLTLYGDRKFNDKEFKCEDESECKISDFSGTHISQAIQGADIIVLADELITLRENTNYINAAPRLIEYTKDIALTNPNAFLVVSAFPVNVSMPIVASVFKELGCYNPRKIVGTTNVNTIHANALLASYLHLDPQSVVLPVIGGASPLTRVPLFSHAIPKDALCQCKREEIIAKIRENGDFKLKNNECNLIEKAYAVVRFIHSIAAGLIGTAKVPEIALVKNEVIGDVDYFSLPIILGKNGVENVLQLKKITENEEIMLKSAIESMKEDIRKANEYFKTFQLDDQVELENSIEQLDDKSNKEKIYLKESDFIEGKEFNDSLNDSPKTLKIPSNNNKKNRFQVTEEEKLQPLNCPAEKYLKTPSNAEELAEDIQLSRKSSDWKIPVSYRNKKKHIGDFKDGEDFQGSNYKLFIKSQGLVEDDVASRNTLITNSKTAKDNSVVTNETKILYDFILNDETQVDELKKNLRKSIESIKIFKKLKKSNLPQKSNLLSTENELSSILKKLDSITIGDEEKNVKTLANNEDEIVDKQNQCNVVSTNTEKLLKESNVTNSIDNISKIDLTNLKSKSETLQCKRVKEAENIKENEQDRNDLKSNKDEQKLQSNPTSVNTEVNKTANQVQKILKVNNDLNSTSLKSESVILKEIKLKEADYIEQNYVTKPDNLNKENSSSAIKDNNIKEVKELEVENQLRKDQNPVELQSKPENPQREHLIPVTLQYKPEILREKNLIDVDSVTKIERNTKLKNFEEKNTLDNAVRKYKLNEIEKPSSGKKGNDQILVKENELKVKSTLNYSISLKRKENGAEKSVNEVDNVEEGENIKKSRNIVGKHLLSKSRNTAKNNLHFQTSEKVKYNNKRNKYENIKLTKAKLKFSSDDSVLRKKIRGSSEKGITGKKEENIGNLESEKCEEKKRTQEVKVHSYTLLPQTRNKITSLHNKPNKFISTSNLKPAKENVELVSKVMYGSESMKNNSLKQNNSVMIESKQSNILPASKHVIIKPQISSRNLQVINYQNKSNNLLTSLNNNKNNNTQESIDNLAPAMNMLTNEIIDLIKVKKSAININFETSKKNTFFGEKQKNVNICDQLLPVVSAEEKAIKENKPLVATENTNSQISSKLQDQKGKVDTEKNCIPVTPSSNCGVNLINQIIEQHAQTKDKEVMAKVKLKINEEVMFSDEEAVYNDLRAVRSNRKKKEKKSVFNVDCNLIELIKSGGRNSNKPISKLQLMQLQKKKIPTKSFLSSSHEPLKEEKMMNDAEKVFKKHDDEFRKISKTKKKKPVKVLVKSPNIQNIIAANKQKLHKLISENISKKHSKEETEKKISYFPNTTNYKKTKKKVPEKKIKSYLVDERFKKNNFRVQSFSNRLQKNSSENLLVANKAKQDAMLNMNTEQNANLIKSEFVTFIPSLQTERLTKIHNSDPSINNDLSLKPNEQKKLEKHLQNDPFLMKKTILLNKQEVNIENKWKKQEKNILAIQQKQEKMLELKKQEKNLLALNEIQQNNNNNEFTPAKLSYNLLLNTPCRCKTNSEVSSVMLPNKIEPNDLEKTSSFLPQQKNKLKLKTPLQSTNMNKGPYFKVTKSKNLENYQRNKNLKLLEQYQKANETSVREETRYKVWIPEEDETYKMRFSVDNKQSKFAKPPTWGKKIYQLFKNVINNKESNKTVNNFLSTKSSAIKENLSNDEFKSEAPQYLRPIKRNLKLSAPKPIMLKSICTRKDKKYFNWPREFVTWTGKYDIFNASENK